MVKPKKFRGVRQRHWGSWVSEIRHPILKRKVWLGTFDTAEEAAKLYDQAAVIMSGRLAKTNFPVSPTQNQSQCETSETRDLSEILHAKLWKCSKAPLPSVICLRLDIENSHIGVWQRRAGHPSKSSWLMRVQLRDHRKTDNVGDDDGNGTVPTSSSSYVINPIEVRSVNGGDEDEEIFNEEQRAALQMIEELLNFDTPSTAC